MWLQLSIEIEWKNQPFLHLLVSKEEELWTPSKLEVTEYDLSHVVPI